MFKRLIQAALQNAKALTPAGMAESLLNQMKAGVPAAEVAKMLANFPGIEERIGDADVETFWSYLMKDPAAQATIHPMDRGALKAYMSDVLNRTRALIGEKA